MNTEGALNGLRVLDLGIITAGAATSQVFADFGADVIKIESTTYKDPFRAWNQIAGGAVSNDLNASPPFWSVNRGKRGVAVDLKTESGRQVFLELVEHADLVVENFRRGVLDRLGIGFDVLHRVNPRIVLLSLSSQGLDGPEAGYVSFGSTLEAVGGSMAVTGYGPGEPLWTGNNINYPDQLVSYLAPGLALAAIRQVRATGIGVHVDAAQREAVTSVVGESIVEYSLTGEVAGPTGNRDGRYVPQGIYPAAGDDEWIAISVPDAAWPSFAEHLGLDRFRGQPGTATRAGRSDRHDNIDEAISFATRDRDPHRLAAELQKIGVAASPVLRPKEVLDHAQLAALGFPTTFDGDPLVHRGFVARLNTTPGRVVRPAPRLGEHTAEILAQRLGYTKDHIEDLHASAAIHCPELEPGLAEPHHHRKVAQ